jgi:hypothetical protein
MLGGGLTLYVRYLFPALFPPAVPDESLAIAGGLLGAALHGLFEKWVVDSFLKPVSLFICYYSRLGRLAAQIRLVRSKVLPGGIQHLTDIVNTLSEHYYLQNKCP